MQENRYFANDRPADVEQERLAALGLMADPITMRRVERLGIGPGWRCLEVGAGDGGLARRLAERVGPTGHITATDINPRFVAEHRLPNIEVRRHDINEEDLEPGHFDLAHCRMVLQHLADPLHALGRMVAAVRPGGWLIVEESDWASHQAADRADPRAKEFDRRARAIIEGVEAGRLIDMHLGRRVRGLVERLGLDVVGDEGTTGISRGGGPAARFIRMSGAIVRTPLLASGVLSAPEFDEHQATYDDPSFSFVSMTLFGAWGRRPG